ncbi:hypothetical protein LTR27_005931 [Elasticomyces elasticus]|nr:hypothetical protein LTR27_005931 [Elasticomyces elasticus]
MVTDQHQDSGGLEMPNSLIAVLNRICEGQAVLTDSILELVSAQKETTQCVKELVAVQREAISSRDNPSSSVRTLDAGSRLTNTYESLEKILLDADMRTVLLAQRVSKTFGATINNSRKLQQKLYFMLAENESAPQLNPLLIEPSVVGRLPLWMHTPRRLAYCSGAKRVSLSVGPLLMQPGIPPRPAKIAWTMSASYNHQGGGYGGGKSCLGPGSWRRMYLVQQPCLAHCVVTEVQYGRSGAMMRQIVGAFSIDAQQIMDKILQSLAAGPLDASTRP